MECRKKLYFEPTCAVMFLCLVFSVAYATFLVKTSSCCLTGTKCWPQNLLAILFSSRHVENRDYFMESGSMRDFRTS